MSTSVSLERVCVTLRGRRVLDELDLAVRPGEIRAIVGLNGAGKTTAQRVLLGMLRPTSGLVRLLGQSLGAECRELWRRVGHLVETPFCYPELTPRENVECSAQLHQAELGAARRECVRLAEVLGLRPWLDTPVRRLSLGSRQKVGLICALAHAPDLVVLDEPTNSLDPLAVVAFRNELDAVRGRGGTVLLASHHFDELARTADWVDVLHRGRIVDTLRPDGGDLENTFFKTILAVDQALQGAS